MTVDKHERTTTLDDLLVIVLCLMVATAFAMESCE